MNLVVGEPPFGRRRVLHVGADTLHRVAATLTHKELCFPTGPVGAAGDARHLLL